MFLPINRRPDRHTRVELCFTPRIFTHLQTHMFSLVDDLHPIGGVDAELSVEGAKVAHFPRVLLDADLGTSPH